MCLYSDVASVCFHTEDQCVIFLWSIIVFIFLSSKRVLYSYRDSVCYIPMKHQCIYSYGSSVCLYFNGALMCYILMEHQCIYSLLEY